MLNQLDTGTSGLNYFQEVEKCQSTLLSTSTRSEIVWGHAHNTNPRVLQVTAWLGVVTPSLCCMFWYNIKYHCWVTRNQRNNLRQTNSSTLYSSYSHFKTKLSLERCSVFTCSIQVCWDQCHHYLFHIQNAISHPALSVWSGRLFMYHSDIIFPKSMEFSICIAVFCHKNSYIPTSRKLSWVKSTLTFLSFNEKQMQMWISQK